MKIKTVTTVDGINSVDFGDNAPRFYWFKNLSDSTLHVSSNPNMIAGGEDVSELPPKSSTSIETTAGKVYVLGAGKVEIHNTDSKFCPFKGVIVVSGGGGYNKSFIGKLKNGTYLIDYNNPLILSNAVFNSTSASNNQLVNDDGTPFFFLPGDADWEMCFKIKFDSLKTRSPIIGSIYKYQTAPSIELTTGGTLWFGISVDGSSWTLNGSTTIESGKDYWVKLGYSSTEGYKFYLSEDGINFELKSEIPDTRTQYQSDSQSNMQLFCVANDLNHIATTETIDLSESYIKFGDTVVWGIKK